MIKTVIYGLIAITATAMTGAVWYLYLSPAEEVDVNDILLYTYQFEQVELEEPPKADHDYLLVSIEGTSNPEAEIASAKLIFEYDPELIEFTDMIEQAIFDTFPQKEIDAENGIVTIAGSGAEVADDSTMILLEYKLLTDAPANLDLVTPATGVISSEEAIENVSIFVDAELDNFYPAPTTFIVTQ